MSPHTVSPPALARLPSGIAGLDTITSGGFITGGLYLIRGAPGAGKTIFTNQVCFHHAAQGGRAIFVTLLAENHARMLDNLRGLCFFDETFLPDRVTYLSSYAEVRDGGLDAVVNLVRREIQHRRATVLVIDGLVTPQISAGSEQAYKQFVHDLQEIALATDCTVFLTTNANEEVTPEQTMVDGIVLLTDRTYGWQAASDLQIKKFRSSAFLRGRHSYKITDGGIEVFPRIEALYAYPSASAGAAAAVDKVSTGVERLDAMVGGGLPAASTTMVMGPSGIGKTTLGLHFISRSSVEQPGLVFSFYETPARLRAKIAQIEPGLLSLIDDGIVEMLWQTPTGDLLDAYGHRLLEAVRRRQVKRLFIDGLTAFQKGSIDPARIGNFFAALANELRVLGVTTVYSLELPDMLGGHPRAPVDDASNIAENMILMRYVERRAQVHRLVSVLKVRDSGFDHSTREFFLAQDGLRISETSATAVGLLESDGGEAAAEDPDRASAASLSPRHEG